MVAIPDPETFVVMPWRSGESKVGRMICDVVTPDGKPYEGDPRYVLRQRARPDEEHGLRHVQRRPRARVLPVQGLDGDGDARRGRLLRDDDAGRRDRAAQRDDPGAREGRHPDRVPPPRGRALAARDRHALRAGARDGRPHAHLPADRQGDRGEERRLRDLHAEADLRRERLGDAHPPVALHRRAQRVLRRGRQVAPVRRRQGVHRRPAPPRPRDLGGVRAVGELVQAARARATRRRSTSPGRSATARR